ncbi:MAG: hypothetical protein VB100_09105 [Angelakisella sp.]|nr:hypothetical protein [Angelakisella sp.]
MIAKKKNTVIWILMGFILCACLTMSANSSLYLFQNSDCEYPCWIGIMPKVTSIQEAIEIINAKNEQYHQRGIFFGNWVKENVDAINLSANEISVWINADQNQIINNFGFSIHDRLFHKTKIDNLVQYFGTPEKIGICVDNRSRVSISYIYPYLDVIALHLQKTSWNLDGEYKFENAKKLRIQQVFVGKGSWTLNRYDFEIPWSDIDHSIILDMSKRLQDSECEKLMGY